MPPFLPADIRIPANQNPTTKKLNHLHSVQRREGPHPAEAGGSTLAEAEGALQRWEGPRLQRREGPRCKVMDPGILKDAVKGIHPIIKSVCW